VALWEAKRRLAERAAKQARDEGDSAESSTGPVELDPAVIRSGRGRREWMREARHQLDEQRRREAKPISRSRAARLLEAERRMQEELALECAASGSYDNWHAAQAAGGA
jgi:hypothetical protein